MARVQPSSSSSSDDEASEVEGDRCKALQKAYCDAITKLTPDIVPVLQHEITAILPKAYSKGLVGNSVYSKGIAMQGDPGQKTGEFLITSQIYIGIEFYNTFLEILRNTEAIGHIAGMDELQNEPTRNARKRRPSLIHATRQRQDFRATSPLHYQPILSKPTSRIRIQALAVQMAALLLLLDQFLMK